MKWFESWFDTAYYHALYANRSEAEADGFISNLVAKLGLESGNRVADIACGKGRHSKKLAELGYQVWGMDLSGNSINQARLMGLEKAIFDVHDMRSPFPENEFDAIFNLFTSFGYFETCSEDEQVLTNMAAAVKFGGVVVQDYLNAVPVVAKIKQDESVYGAEIIYCGNLEFEIKKTFDLGNIVKNILVKDGGKTYLFQERVKIYTLDELCGLHQKAGLTVEYIFGDYQLNDFVSEQSPRMVVVSRKL